MFEYTSAVFAVGLDGFAPVDNDRITAMAADGWEPTQMASIHGGFAAVVLFRREAGSAPASRARTASAPASRARTTTAAKASATRTRKVPPPAAPARASATGRAASSRAARSAPSPASTKAKATAAPRTRTTRGR